MLLSSRDVFGGIIQVLTQGILIPSDICKQAREINRQSLRFLIFYEKTISVTMQIWKILSFVDNL